MMNPLSTPLSIAPMIDWSTSNFRILMRILAPHALVYTEMLTTQAVLHQPQRSLTFNPIEEPLALQLGGSDQEALKQACLLANLHPFTEINLNLGCPSARVQSGRFGACLMKEPQLVRKCIEAMKESSSRPISAKLRIGIDSQDGFDFFLQFVDVLVASGCDKIIVHARKAWLSGLSPKENRIKPPLHYDYAYRIKSRFMDIPVIINGNITEIADIFEHLKHLDGVMIGRLACQNPYEIARIHHALYPKVLPLSRAEIVNKYFHVLGNQVENTKAKSAIIKPILNLAHGLKNQNQWKKSLLEHSLDAPIKLNLIELIGNLESN